MTVKKPLYYPDYLALPTILNAQNPESVKHHNPAHDEMLFIITHQTFELWFKQFLHELDSILELYKKPHLQDEDMNIVVSRLSRIARIQKLMIRQFNVLETMSPQDFLGFRDYLIPASGFQSVQFKIIEKKLGIVLMEKYQKYSSEALESQDLENLESISASLFSGIEKWLERNPFLSMGKYSFEREYKKMINDFISREMDMIRNHPMIEKEKSDIEITKMEGFKKSLQSIFDEKVYKSEVAEGKKKFSRKAFLSALFIRLYRHYAILQMPYQILDLLIDINENHVTWKQRHLQIIQRMIGMKIGTGGTSGKDFLSDTIRQSYVFSDLIQMPSYMVAKNHVPELPEELRKKLGYYYA
jgi:tryptophan 2,3-dioxygenase